MAELTQQQARDLAEEFFELSKAVGDFRFDHFDTLTPEERAALQSLQQQLSNQSNHFTAIAIQVTLDDLQGSLARIGQITGQVKHAVTTLNDVRRVIGIATSVVGLGAAIATGNPGTIIAAIEDTAQSVRAT